MDTLFFHGSSKPNLQKLRPSAAGLFGSGIYVSNSLEDAAEYGTFVYSVHLRCSRPFITRADYSLAATCDCDSPAGNLLRDLFGIQRAKEYLREIAHMNFGVFSEEKIPVQKTLLILGYDSIMVHWKSDMRHCVLFSSEHAQIVGKPIELAYS